MPGKTKWAMADTGSFGGLGFAPHERKLGSDRNSRSVPSDITAHYSLPPSWREKQR